jgi:hypothetical protein
VLAAVLLLASSAAAGPGDAARAASHRTQAAQVGRTLARQPSEAKLRDFVEHVEAGDPGVNIMALLFFVFRESIEQTNEDKKYFLAKLRMYDTMGEALSEYLSELAQAARDMGSPGNGQAGGCGGAEADARADQLDRAAARVQARIAELAPEARGSPDVRQLDASLARDRALIALARRELRAAAARHVPVARPEPRKGAPAPRPERPVDPSTAGQARTRPQRSDD